MARIKGVALVGIVKALRSFGASAKAGLPQDLWRYFNERVIVSQWYPEEDYRALILRLGELLRKRIEGDVWEFLGEEGGRAQFTNVYALAFRKNDPVGTLKRATATWALYHDTGSVTVDIDKGANRARVELRDYPVAGPEICGTTTGYLRQLLVMSGAQDVTVRMTACPPPDRGPVVWEVSWQVLRSG